MRASSNFIVSSIKIKLREGYQIKNYERLDIYVQTEGRKGIFAKLSPSSNSNSVGGWVSINFNFNTHPQKSKKIKAPS